MGKVCATFDGPRNGGQHPAQVTPTDTELVCLRFASQKPSEDESEKWPCTSSVKTIAAPNKFLWIPSAQNVPNEVQCQMWRQEAKQVREQTGQRTSTHSSSSSPCDLTNTKVGHQSPLGCDTFVGSAWCTVCVPIIIRRQKVSSGRVRELETAPQSQKVTCFLPWAVSRPIQADTGPSLQTERSGRPGQLQNKEKEWGVRMWSGLSEVAEGNRSHFYRQRSEFPSVPSDCSSDLKVQNLIADQVGKGKVIICLKLSKRKNLSTQCQYGWISGLPHLGGRMLGHRESVGGGELETIICFRPIW